MKEMNELKKYDIKFSGLKNGNHRYAYHINRDFFDLFDYDEFDDANIDIVIDLIKRDNLLEFQITGTGSVNVACDLSGEYFDQSFESELRFIIKFGQAFNDDREDLIILPYQSHTFNVAQQIYESLVLSVPVKRIHPDIVSGKMKPKGAAYIVNYENSVENTDENKDEIDPRWAALKKILTDKN